MSMVNGHDLCHGGLIATLADSAFAFACNSYNELTVASGFAIDLLAPGKLGDLLTARCHEVSKAGRTGVYDCEVTNQRGERVAVFRGRSHTMKGKPGRGRLSSPGATRPDDARETPHPGDLEPIETASRDELQAAAAGAPAMDACSTPTRTCRTTAARSMPGACTRAT